MGKIDFTPIQQIFFDEISNDKIVYSRFYFTGGTALSVFHFGHRYSDDLDFFTQNPFEKELVVDLMTDICRRKKFHLQYTDHERVKIFNIYKKEKPLLKVDFAYYPYTRLETGQKVGNITVDSLLDIGANKIAALSGRYEAKDLVDLYFLLKKFTVWDLWYAAQKKFKLDLDIVLIAADFLYVEKIETLPKMILPLTLPELKTFFREEAKKLAKTVVE